MTEIIAINKTCRVCLSEDNDIMVAPCGCNGTIKYIHMACLEKWIKISGNGETCPSCKTYYTEEFIIKPSRRGELIEFFMDWSFITVIQVLLVILLFGIVFDGQIKIYYIVHVIIPIFITIRLINLFINYRIQFSDINI
jgi:hypothetical protein